MNKTALMIAYYFPPLGMGGVQRMAKLARYLPQHGYDVMVLTVKPIRYPAHDVTMLEELPESVSIFRSGSSDPARIAKIVPLPAKAGSRVKTLAKERSNRFWPDSKIGWKRPALRLARKIIADHNIDVIISSSPPITGHLVAMDIKEQIGIPWVADFRDPWESRSPQNLYTKEPLIEKSNLLLREITNSADVVTTINDSISRALSSDARTIMGGYDPDDFEHLEEIRPEEDFTLCYMGTVGPLHPIEPFFEAAQIAVGIDSELMSRIRFRIIGANDAEYLEKSAGNYDLHESLELIDYLPHREALRKAASAAVSVISVPHECPEILTGKIFDYLALPAPILASAPTNGEIAGVIDDCRCGICVQTGEKQALAESLMQLFHNHQRGILWDKGEISNYTRSKVARRFAEIFDRIVHG